MIPDWTIGDRLAKARRYADLTVIEMAERLDVHRNSVGAWGAPGLRQGGVTG